MAHTAQTSADFSTLCGKLITSGGKYASAMHDEDGLCCNRIVGAYVFVDFVRYGHLSKDEDGDLQSIKSQSVAYHEVTGLKIAVNHVDVVRCGNGASKVMDNVRHGVGV